MEILKPTIEIDGFLWNGLFISIFYVVVFVFSASCLFCSIWNSYVWTWNENRAILAFDTWNVFEVPSQCAYVQNIWDWKCYKGASEFK